MNSKIILFFSFIVLSLFSCKQTKKQDQDSTNTEINSDNKNVNSVMANVNKHFTVNTELSTIHWKCDKLIGKGHEGYVLLSDGIIHAKDDALKAGEMQIDMKSITCTDITDKAKNADLVSHLKDADFFDVASFPTAKLTIERIGYNADTTQKGSILGMASLKIKDKSDMVSVPATVSFKGNDVFVKAKFSIDRKKWGIVYGTEGSVANLTKDKIISNIIEFDVNIKATLQ